MLITRHIFYLFYNFRFLVFNYICPQGKICGGNMHVHIFFKKCSFRIINKTHDIIVVDR